MLQDKKNVYSTKGQLTQSYSYINYFKYSYIVGPTYMMISFVGPLICMHLAINIIHRHLPLSCVHYNEGKINSG